MENYNNDEELVVREPITAYGKKLFTIEEYLEFENASPEKHEYYQGEIFPMAGASNDHAAIERNLLVVLTNALKRTHCRPWPSSLRIYIPSNTLFTYPDITVACRDELSSTETGEDLPKVLIEVLSPSTRKYDQSKKFELYKDIPSLQEYILVDTKRVAIDIYRKTAENTWELQQYTKKDRTILIKSLNLRISFNNIYEDVLFNEYSGWPVMRPVGGNIDRA